jgi:hypothetical protein
VVTRNIRRVLCSLLLVSAPSFAGAPRHAGEAQWATVSVVRAANCYFFSTRYLEVAERIRWKNTEDAIQYFEAQGEDVALVTHIAHQYGQHALDWNDYMDRWFLRCLRTGDSALR